MGYYNFDVPEPLVRALESGAKANDMPLSQFVTALLAHGILMWGTGKAAPAPNGVTPPALLSRANLRRT